MGGFRLLLRDRRDRGGGEEEEVHGVWEDDCDDGHGYGSLLGYGVCRY